MRLTLVIPLRGRLGLNDSGAVAEGFCVALGPRTLSTALTEGFVHGASSLKILIPIFVGEYSVTVCTQADALC